MSISTVLFVSLVIWGLYLLLKLLYKIGLEEIKRNPPQ